MLVGLRRDREPVFLGRLNRRAAVGRRRRATRPPDYFDRAREPQRLAEPDSVNLDARNAIVEDRDRPFYEHRLAA